MCCFDHLHSRLTALINQTNLFFVLQGIKRRGEKKKRKRAAENAAPARSLVNKLNDLSIQTNLEKTWRSGALSRLAWPHGEGDTLALQEISLIPFGSDTHCMLMAFAQQRRALERLCRELRPGALL